MKVYIVYQMELNNRDQDLFILGLYKDSEEAKRKIFEEAKKVKLEFVSDLDFFEEVYVNDYLEEEEHCITILYDNHCYNECEIGYREIEVEVFCIKEH